MVLYHRKGLFSIKNIRKPETIVQHMDYFGMVMVSTI